MGETNNENAAGFIVGMVPEHTSLHQNNCLPPTDNWGGEAIFSLSYTHFTLVGFHDPLFILFFLILLHVSFGKPYL